MMVEGISILDEWVVMDFVDICGVYNILLIFGFYLIIGGDLNFMV